MPYPHEFTEVRDQVIRHEIQIDRMKSDIESEKGTRARSSERFDERFNDLDRRMRNLEWKVSGGIAVLGVLQIIVFVLLKGNL